MINSDKMIFISGGGTGGHLFPAITIGEKLKENGYKVTFIGSKYGMEANYFKLHNTPVKLLDIYGIQRTLSIYNIFKNIIFPIKFIKSYYQSIKLIKKLKPIAIIGTGGYSSGLPLLAGIRLKIPTLIQDQNSIPGLITKKLHKYISTICVAYEDFKITNNDNNIILTGNPIRSNLNIISRDNALKTFKLASNKKTILILGGSQGAMSINNHLVTNINFYLNQNYQIIWQTGDKNYNIIPNSIKKNKNIVLKKFFNDMRSAYCAADLVISRAGALAISELLYMNKAFILIPFKYSADNHQDMNAKYIESRDACIRINENSLNDGLLEKNIKHFFLNSEKIMELEENARLISRPNATNDILNEITKIINGKNTRKN